MKALNSHEQPPSESSCLLLPEQSTVSASLAELTPSEEHSHFYSHVKKGNYWLADDAAHLNYLERNYLRFKASTGRTFPKFIHFVWLGPKAIPSTFAAVRK